MSKIDDLVNFRCTPALHARIKRCARLRDKKMAQFIRDALLEKVESIEAVEKLRAAERAAGNRNKQAVPMTQVPEVPYASGVYARAEVPPAPPPSRAVRADAPAAPPGAVSTELDGERLILYVLSGRDEAERTERAALVADIADKTFPSKVEARRFVAKLDARLRQAVLEIRARENDPYFGQEIVPDDED